MSKGNHTGAKWTSNGAKCRNKLYVELSGFEDLIVRLDELVDDVRPAISDALEQAAEMVETDTEAAMSRKNLPAQGRYSTGDTERSIVRNARVDWSGTKGEIGLGFDKTKKGAGGFLITGTPRMRPNWKLEDIYARKKYQKEVNEAIQEALENAIEEAMK